MTTVFTTPRLLIRAFEPADWPDFLDMNSNKAVIERIGNGQLKTIDEERVKFDSILHAYTKGGELGIWSVTLLSIGQGVLGAASMSLLEGTREVQLGYRFKPSFWGRGYATEVAQGLVAYGFGPLNLSRIVATTNLDNNASRRVLEKAGLRFERAGIWYGCEMNYFAIEKAIRR
jgi:ribosomal-protein-alanine N-acetyltransferase